LGKGERHWKKGYSAYELAHCWLGAADGVPERIRVVLDQSKSWQGAELLEAFFELETDLRSKGRPSQTDLLGLFRLSGGLGVLAVEDKVEEPFGPLVDERLADGSPSKRRRLEVLCEAVDLAPENTKPLRYQLLHRAAAALFEAERYRASEAIMLVHSFSRSGSWYDDFARFSEALGLLAEGPNQVSGERFFGKTTMRLAWVGDEPQP